MPARKSQLLLGIAAAAVLAIGAAWLRLATGDAPEPHRSIDRDRGAGGGTAPSAAGGAGAAPGSSASPGPGGEAAATGAPDAHPPASPAAAARPAPDEGPDGAAWRNAKVAFQLRELGRMAPYVKTALDAARRDMAFCFRKAAARAGDPGAGGAEAGSGPAQPAVLLLYLEAREGALDVVDTRADYLGDASPELVECCREVLRGLEIPAFGAVPGQRYRLKLRLE